MTNLSKTRLVSVAAVAALLAACSGNSQSGLSPSQSTPASEHGTQSSEQGFVACGSRRVGARVPAVAR